MSSHHIQASFHRTAEGRLAARVADIAFLALPAEGQAKEVVRRHADRTYYLDTFDAGVLSDIDDPEAYRMLQESAQ